MTTFDDDYDAQLRRAGEEITGAGTALSDTVTRRGPVTGRAASGNGAITVTVLPGGKLTEVEIDGSALRMHPDQLAKEILDVARRATRSANAVMYSSARSALAPEVAATLAVPDDEPTAERRDNGEDFSEQFGAIMRSPYE